MLRHMKRALSLLLLLVTASCRMGYGPLEDHSEFVSTRLSDDKTTAIFSFHRYAYRQATGIRAFPDGGIPYYDRDINILGTYNLQTQKLRILKREKNSEWCPGSGMFYIHSIKGNKALINQGGQLRGPFKLAGKYILLDFVSGTTLDLDLNSDLAKRGRDTGQIYLTDTNGTLVFVNVSLDEAKNPKAHRDKTIIPELWVRTSGGDYLKAAASSHYERTLNGEVIYWEPSTRDFMAFSITGRTTRKVPGYKVPDFEDVYAGVSLSSNRKGLESGLKINGKWEYTPLNLNPDVLK